MLNQIKPLEEVTCFRVAEFPLPTEFPRIIKVEMPTNIKAIDVTAESDTLVITYVTRQENLLRDEQWQMMEFIIVTVPSDVGLPPFTKLEKALKLQNGKRIMVMSRHGESVKNPNIQ